MTSKTLISHFYNEEYLLPWWLNHHKKIFDKAVLIDYNSTDRSVEIIKEICPHWEVVKSRNEFFGARDIDSEVEDIEKAIAGWKMCLNTTEFLLGDLSILESGPDIHTMPCVVMVDNEPNVPAYNDIPLFDQKMHGIHYDEGAFGIRRARAIHKKSEIVYPLGRHFESFSTNQLLVLWYGWSPLTEQVIKRKMQIQNKMPESDKQKGLGTGHLLDMEKFNSYYNHYMSLSRDLSKDLETYKNMTRYSL